MNGARILLVCLLAGALSACGTINSWLAQGMADHVPHWAGGTPADAPPRPGTPQYEEYRRQVEGNAAQAGAAPQPAPEPGSSKAIY